MSYSQNSPLVFKNQESIAEKYKCSWCKGLFRDPKQLSCGHRICSLCVPEASNVIDCLVCHEQTPKSELILDKGFKNDMGRLMVACNECDWNTMLKDYESHMNEYHRMIPCDYCQRPFPTAEALKNHQDTTCDKIPVQCELYSHGCMVKLHRFEKAAHYLSSGHQACVVKLLGERKLNSTSDSLEMQSTAGTDTSSMDGEEMDLDDGLGMVNVFDAGIKALGEETVRLEKENETQTQITEQISQRLAGMKSSMEETRASYNAFATNMSVLQFESFHVKDRLNEQPLTSFDGTLVWRITNVSSLMNAAESERQTSIYSPHFYSSKSGYKMCARLYPNGDGNARHTHMSLFFVLMRTPHDSILKFPFKYKVTFCLFDLSGSNRHLVDSFRPDEKSNSFQRPKSDMNIASGIPKFVPLAIIKNRDTPYVKNDTMFIRIVVDFAELPKKVLPYALKLNPALPMHIQQVLINREMERQAQQNPTTVDT